MKKIGALIIVLLAIFSVIPQGFTYEEPSPEIQTTGDYFSAIGTKTGRGLWNVISSLAEIPCTVNQDMKDGDAGSAFFTGTGKGLVFMLRRMLVGVTEVGTFMIPAGRTIPPVCREPQGSI